MSKIFKISKIPSNEIALKNRLVFNPNDILGFFASYKGDEVEDKVEYYVEIEGRRFGIWSHTTVKAGYVGLSAIQRNWLNVGLETPVNIKPLSESKNYASSIVLEVDFQKTSKATKDSYNTDEMQTDFQSMFDRMPLTKSQELAYKFKELPLLTISVKDLKDIQDHSVSNGIVYQNTAIVFNKKEDSMITLTGKAKGKSAMPTIINPDWDFSQMGIGGLDDQFSAIFRRAFASRVFPPDLIEELGMQHVKGILLFGPPGTGKTLMARQIGKMLNAREPIIVNGPEILNKYVGESEANIRKLFEAAEQDQKKFGINSGLHMVIFDEIDAICKQRGSVTGSTGVADTVVNQLLAKIDGVEQLNNILIIGMTNRKDLIDEALLRPGRLEVQMEIGLPSEGGRVQILEIHTAKLKSNHKMQDDVKLDELAAITKNFSGAELEGVVRAATTTAMNRLVKAESTVTIDPNAVESLKVTRADFINAIVNDIKPAFGAGNDDSDQYIANGIIEYGKPIQHIMEDGKLLVKQTRMGQLVSPVTVLFEGPGGSGKTALAAYLAYKTSGFPFIKVVSAKNMIGYSESAKCQAIKKIFDDAYKSELSCVIVDDIERLIEYVPIGPRFSNVILQALIVLLKNKVQKGKKLLIIGTTSCREVLEQMQMLTCFNTIIHVPTVTRVEHLKNIVTELDVFSGNEIESIVKEVSGKNINISINKLISLVEMAIQSEDKVGKFVELLSDQCGIPFY